MIQKISILLAIFALAHAQNPSPCPTIFQYDATKKSSGKWEGALTFDTEFELSGMWVRVILDKKADLGNDEFHVVTDDNVSFLIRMPDTTLTPGHPVKIPIWVKYDEKKGVPSVANVRLNARSVCPPAKEAVAISPCPGTFKYTALHKKEEGRWHGELSLDSEFQLDGVWIRVFLDRKGEILADGFGEVEPRDSNSFLIRKKNYVLTPTETLKVPFIVKYDDPKSIPNIITVRLNARTICESKLASQTAQQINPAAQTVDKKEHAHNHHH